MPLTEQEKAGLSQARGRLAAGIKDPEERRKFIGEQGEVDRKGGKDIDYAEVAQKTSGEQAKQALDDVLGGPTQAEAAKAPYSLVKQ